MKAAAVLAACCSGATAFVPGAVPRASFAVKPAPAASSSATVTMMAKSASVPFLECPANLDGTMVGDLGFDPLLLSDTINLKYAQAAELKHGRIAMLAITGFITEQFVHLPGDQFGAGPLGAISAVPLAGHLQILLAISIFEFSNIKQLYSEDSTDAWDMLIQDPRAAKDFYKYKPEKQELRKLQEIKHGRAAMMAIVGAVVQMMVFGKGSLDF